ncbi:hypothetical protein LC048_07480 [Mesobacillus subterraneus]|uniref:hypothetical protein n=1 Tax=Mesobacillus TaxID=2675231 RepID=UPI000C85521B|nr:MULTISPECIES: hypothetical protein [Mesobacillus]WLR56717.1 hypothetical protein LC048_07480 [Mesobacillus subterraneus]
MRPIIRSVSIIILLLVLALVYFWNTDKKNERNEVTDFNHSATMNIQVIERYKDNDRFSGFGVKARNVNTPFQEFYITIEDERVYNLIEDEKEYFVNVTWESQGTQPEISGKSTKLLQIEHLDSEQ